MRIPPFYKITPEILELISKIEANRLLFTSLNIPLSVKEKIQRVSLLKSSLYSARIEGNPLTLTDIQNNRNSNKKTEVLNIQEAVHYIDINLKLNQQLQKDTVLNIHKLVMKNIFPSARFFRKEISAIYNQAGVAVYLTPPPQQVMPLITQLFDYINSDKEKFPIINAFINHLVFEKIHPFLDGNGRVGRLLVFCVFRVKGWEFNLAIPFEEYLDEHKDEYYFYLDCGIKNTNDYLLFMLKAFYEETEKIRSQVQLELDNNSKKTIILPPRQEELYYIIKDHNCVSFDFIRRRFMIVPGRTLRYDLKKLQEKNFIVKTGNTKGVFYKPQNI